MKTLIGYEITTDNGDGSVSVRKFKTEASAKAYLQAEFEEFGVMLCDCGPDPVYLEDYEDKEFE